MDLEDMEIVKFVGSNNFYKGKNYCSSSIEYVNSNENENEDVDREFYVKSESSYNSYNVNIIMNNNKIVKTKCDCEQYKLRKSCKHIAACLIKYKKDMFMINDEERLLTTSHKFLTTFYDDKKTLSIKKLIKLEIILNVEHRYKIPFINLKLYIGENKMYSLNNKLYKFLNAYTNQDENIVFGKNFVYNPNTTYFSKEDKILLAYLSKKVLNENNNYYNYYNYSALTFKDNDANSLLDIIKNREFTIEKIGLIKGAGDQNPLQTELTKKDDNYIFSINYLSKIKSLTSDYNYILMNNVLYHLPDEISKIVLEMKKYELKNVVFKEKDLPFFIKGILPKVKDNIKIDNKINNIIIGNKPSVKLYFDFNKDKIECDIKLDYNGNIISYFDTTATILRDEETENKIIKDLTDYHFSVLNNKIVLDDLDEIVEFLDIGIENISQLYEVFTSQKIKDTNVINKTNIKSNFSIGQDNIMSYDFDLGNIKSEELINILDNMKQKKKYYHLKNGDFINTSTNDNLNQLSNLIEDMELSNKDIKNGQGIIPKYRAIYLDSLKKEKYNIINTNNLFDNLISDFNKFKTTNIVFSSLEKDILRDYQLIGIKWLYNIYKCGFGGILADEMGLGKSIQLIYLIKLILREKPTAKILIIAPTSLIYNWKNEFDKFGKEIKYKIFAENKTIRINNLENIDDVNVLITTYGLARQDREQYLKINFELIAIDEAQNIKNPNTMITKTVKDLKAHTKLALTGTPLENSVLELWSIFDFIMPGYLANITSFQKKYNIKTVENDSLKKLSTLNKQITPFILRRKKKNVIKELPDKIENNVFLDLYPAQKELYLAQLKKTKEEMDELMSTEGFTKARFKILQLLTKLRQICIDPTIIFENYKGGSVKIDNLISLVKEIIDNDHKILIFTSYRTALEIVKERFNKDKISSYIIDGSVSSKKRMELVDAFNTDSTNVFLIMLKAGGTGLNLTSADVVIHLDLWWNPQVENQATDRTHRIGQKNTVEVIRLICKGTIEERILELQNKKKILSDTLIEGKNRDQNIISKLTEKDIKNILAFDNSEE